MCLQSPVPWRTIRALVNAANDIVMAKMPTQMPLCVAWECPDPSTIDRDATC